MISQPVTLLWPEQSAEVSAELPARLQALAKGSRLLLYVGCWLAFWEDNHPFPICFGIEDDAPVVKDAFKQAFANAYKTDAILFGEWTMGWVPEEDFTGPDAVERIWSKLEPIWEAVSTATN